MKSRTRPRRSARCSTLAAERLEPRQMLAVTELLPTLDAVRDRAYQVVDATLVFDPRQEVGVTATNVGSEVVLYRFKPLWSMDYRMQAVATKGSSIDPVIALYGPEGDRIAWHDDVSISDSSSRLDMSLTAGATYTLAVTSYDIGVSGGYRVAVRANLVDDAHENNDTIRTATRIRQLDGGVFSGVLADAHDMFRLDLPGVARSGSNVTVEFRDQDGDIDLALRDAAGRVITASRGSTGQETLLLGGLSAGTYYIDVYGYGGSYSPAYTLTSSVTPGTGRAVVIANDRFEANNTRATAKDLGTIRATSRASSLSLTRGDVDFFKFALAQAGTATSTVSVNFDAALGDVDCKLMNSAGQVIATSEGVSSTEQISLAGRAAGTYYLKVYGFSRASNPGYSVRFDHGTVLSQPVELPYTGPIAPPPPPVLPPEVTTGAWTVAVYMTSSDLASYGFDDVNEMEAAVAQFRPGARITLFWDQWSKSPFSTPVTGGGASSTAWGSAGRASIDPDTDMNRVATDFELVGEQNTGDPAVLRDFLTWTMNVAPANHYAVVLWNHGGGLSGVNFDDESGFDSLTVKEIQQAFAQSGMKPGVLAYDACLMGNVEQFYELRAVAPFQVGSEEVIGGPGYDYTKAFTPLAAAATVSVTPEAFARGLVNAFTASYVTDGKSTLSAIRSDAMAAVAGAVKTFAGLAAGFTPAQAARLVTIAKAVTRFEFPQYIDMKQFMTRAAGAADLPAAARTAARAVVQTVDAAVVARMADARQTGGMSLYVPTSAAEELPGAGLFTDWAAATNWAAVINRMLRRSAPSRAGIGSGAWATFAPRRR